ncbi:MAG: LysM peptidoglycan-binding domain-containing protein [Anaerolineales bacterium]|nr:LysM peptidoglycan-binding domain-containing protein [Anaerolineales bacterium]
MKAYPAVRSLVLVAALAAAVAVAGAPSLALAAPSAQANLVSNGGMETFASNGLATGWDPWWQTIPNPGNGSLNYAQPPDFAPETNPVFVHGGGSSAHIGRNWDPWFGGIRQTIVVAPGSVVRITAYGRVRASTDHYPAPSDTAVQSRMQVGAEPNGSIDWAAGSVVWGGQGNPHDTWQAFTVDVTAGAAGKVTIFLATNYKGDSRFHLDAWWDDVTATVISTGAPQNTSSAPQNTSSAPQNTSGAPAATNPPPANAATSTPDADGNIIYVVQAGDALWSIAARFGLTVDELKAMNGLTSDIISIGQKLIVATSTPSASPTPTVDPNQPTADPNASPTSDPALASPTPEVDAAATLAAVETQAALATDTLATGTVCALLWNDANGNGVRDAAEGLLPGGQLAVVDIATGAPVQAYTTDGVNEPHCFEDLIAGQYTISAAAPGGYNPTTNTSTPLEVTAGSTSTLEFGAQPRAGVEEPTDTPPTSSSQALLTALLFAGGVVFLLLAAGVAGFLFLRRPRAR